MKTTTMAYLAGIVSAGVALATAEAVSGMSDDGRSLVVIVGDGFVDATSGVLAGPAIESLGSANKPALIAGIVVVSLLAGALLGRAALRRWWISPLGFGAFAGLGVFAAVQDSLSEGATAIVGAFLGAIAGVATLWWLLYQATGQGTPFAEGRSSDATTTSGPRATLATGTSAPPGSRSTLATGAAAPAIRDPADRTAGRRAFFAWAGAAGATAAVLAVAGRALGGPSVAEVARENVQLPPTDSPVVPPVSGPVGSVEGLSPYITPNADFFRIDTALMVPDVDPDNWTLSITGMVDEPYEITYDELLSMSTTEAPITIACVSNMVGGDLVGNAIWQGVPLGALLERAGVQPEATQIVGRSVDDFTVGFPTETAFDGRNALVAVGMNGEPLPRRNGFPARLVVSGLFGYVSATKWLSELELTTWEGFDAYWVPRGWSKEGPVLTQSRIDVPNRRNQVAGPIPIAGVAWAPDKGIERVEVRIDEGPWVEADLGEALSNDTWRQWSHVWDATPGEHKLEVRATDGDGETQTEDRSTTAPSGATGWHRRFVDVSTA